MEHLVSENVSHIFGICGVITYLLAYALLQAGVIGGNGYLYALMNASAACMVMVSLIHAYNLASFLIQVSFVVISIGGIIRVSFLTRVARFKKEEQMLYDSQFPNLEPHLARKLLNAGIWTDLAPGTVITSEGEELNRLIYISSGSAEIFLQGQLIGHRGASTFIGEMSFLDDSAATTTVRIKETVHGFVLPVKRLKALMERHSEIRFAITSSFSANTRDTLRKRTEEIVGRQHLTFEN